MFQQPKTAELASSLEMSLSPQNSAFPNLGLLIMASDFFVGSMPLDRVENVSAPFIDSGNPQRYPKTIFCPGFGEHELNRAGGLKTFPRDRGAFGAQNIPLGILGFIIFVAQEKQGFVVETRFKIEAHFAVSTVHRWYMPCE